MVNLVLEDSTNIALLVKRAFNVSDKLSIKAFWVLEFIVKEDIKLIFPYIDYLSSNCSKVTFGSAVRPLSKIIQILVHYDDKQSVLTVKQKELLTETLFDWMISDHKVAIKAYSMYSLFLLGKHIDWIHTELQNIIIANSEMESSAYKARGRITLTQITNYKQQKSH